MVVLVEGRRAAVSICLYKVGSKSDVLKLVVLDVIGPNTASAFATYSSRRSVKYLQCLLEGWRRRIESRLRLERTQKRTRLELRELCRAEAQEGCCCKRK